MLGTHVLHDGRTLVVIGRNAEHKIVGIYLDDRAARTGRFVVLDECELGPVVGKDRSVKAEAIDQPVMRFTPDDMALICELIRKGVSMTKLASKYFCSIDLMSTVFWFNGFALSRDGMRYEESASDAEQNQQIAATVAAKLAQGIPTGTIYRESRLSTNRVQTIGQLYGLVWDVQMRRWTTGERPMNESQKTGIVQALLSGRSVLDVGRQFGQNIPNINRIAESAGLVFERGTGSGHPGKWVKPAQTQAEYDDLLVSDRERKAKEIIDQRLPAQEVTSDQAEAIVVMQSHMQAHQPIDRPSDPDLAAAFDLLAAAAKRAADQNEKINKFSALTEEVVSKTKVAVEERDRVVAELITVTNERATLESEVKRLMDALKTEISKTSALQEKIDRGLFRAQLERTREAVLG